MKTKAPTFDHVAFRDDLLAVLKRHSGHLDAADMMALAAYTTGQILAMQDARKWTSELAMGVIIKNLEEGNSQAIADAAKWMGIA